MKIDLQGQVALVTGAARGIGQAIADALSGNGATVAYTDREEKPAQEAAARRPPGRAYALDVTSEKQVEDVIGRVVHELGRLDILVNNAGVNTLAHRVPVDEFPRMEWDRILDVDLNGLFLVSRAGAQVMRRQGSGRIINITSIAGVVPLRNQCAFVAAKSAVANLTRAMAIELAPAGILVNAIAPGSTLTEGTRQLFYGPDAKFRESMQRLLAHVPLGRPGEAKEIAQAALFLSDPENTYVTGHVLVVDGGWTAGYIRDF
ncbi:MAG: glucose 1-dehydrogenase [Planctomycetes bacterium]|nr:glucose 1-dehydrogenase [Planctomycetota bacterium]